MWSRRRKASWTLGWKMPLKGEAKTVYQREYMAAERYINELLMGCGYGTKVVYLALGGQVVDPATGETLGTLKQAPEVEAKELNV